MASDAARARLLGTATLTVALGYLTWQTLRMPSHHPSRLVAELRLAQAAAVLLAFSAPTGRAVLDLLHLPGWLPGPVEDTTLIGSVIVNGLAALCCVAPLAQRRYS